jgi:hypothetical protein
MWSRRIERIGGVLGGGLGLAALGVALLAPLSTECIDTPAPGRALCSPVSQVQGLGMASLVFPITVFGGLSLGIALLAWWHSLARSLPALILLWACTTLLWTASVKTLFAVLSIGILFVPAAVLALVASLSGTVAASQRVPAHG